MTRRAISDSPRVTTLPARGTPFVCGAWLVSSATPLAISSLLLLAAASASAQDGTAPRWPRALKERNARYANLTRVDDPATDERERRLQHALLTRVDDRLGDLEVERLHRLGGQVPPRAVLHARITRERSLGDDAQQVVLAGLTTHRRHAETRRFRDLGGDEEVLALHREDLLRNPGADRVMIASQEKDGAHERYAESREDVRRQPGQADLRGREAQEDREEKRASERDLLRDEGFRERDGGREARREARREASEAREVEAALERDADQDAEKKAEKAEERAGAKDDARIEKAGERNLEKQGERRDDRNLERQQEREERGGTATTN